MCKYLQESLYSYLWLRSIRHVTDYSYSLNLGEPTYEEYAWIFKDGLILDVSYLKGGRTDGSKTIKVTVSGDRPNFILTTLLIPSNEDQQGLIKLIERLIEETNAI